MAYLNVTFNVKPKMQNRSAKSTGLANLGGICGLTGTGLGLVCQESAGRVFGLVWKQTNLFLQFKPGLRVGYPHPLRKVTLTTALATALPLALTAAKLW
jgi:hypothetical protein